MSLAGDSAQLSTAEAALRAVPLQMCDTKC